MSTYDSVQVASALADYAAKYENAEMIADLVCPPKEANKKLFKYWKYSRADANRITDSAVAPTGMPNRRHFSTTTSQVEVLPYALFDLVAKSDIATQDAPLDLESDTVEDLTNDLLLGREQRVATLLTTAASYASANKATLSVAWTNRATSTPIEDIQTAKRACAMPPNVMICDEVSFDALASHPAVLSGLRSMGGQFAGLASKEEIARYFGFEAVYVGRCKYNSAKPGQTESYSYLWPQGKVVIGRIPKAPRTKEAMLCRTFRFRPENTEGAITIDIEEQKQPGAGGGVLMIKASVEEVSVLVSADTGYLISSAA